MLLSSFSGLLPHDVLSLSPSPPSLLSLSSLSSLLSLSSYLSRARTLESQLPCWELPSGEAHIPQGTDIFSQYLARTWGLLRVTWVALVGPLSTSLQVTAVPAKTLMAAYEWVTLSQRIQLSHAQDPDLQKLWHNVYCFMPLTFGVSYAATDS